MIASKKTPNHIGFVDPLRVSPDSVRGPELRHTRLKEHVVNNEVSSREWNATFWDEQQGSIAEEKAAQELAVHYLLKTALRLTEVGSPEVKVLLSDRYTHLSQERFGAPDPARARSLFATENEVLLENAEHQGVDLLLVERYRGLINSIELKDDVASEEVSGAIDIEYMRREMQEIIETRYSKVFTALDLDNLPESINPQGIADAFDRALAVLVEEYDESWSDWKVVLDDDADSIVVRAEAREIVVGMLRAPVSRQELKALTAHEVLTHAQRAVNGYKISELAGDGLPGFVDIEEGMGIFNEYAVSGILSDKHIDRYVDIALALGQIDGKKHSRAELIELSLTRAHIRNQMKASNLRLSEEGIESQVYTSINRIYRGSLGNEFVGVFTKDHVYYSGFTDFCMYLQQQRAMGKTIEEIYDYIMQARFNPLLESNVDELESMKRYNEQ